MQLRPEEVVHWGRQRSSIPSIDKGEQFCEQWVTWWGSCQPKWRSVEAWPFPHDEANEDWARLNVTGPHGLFAVVMSASWWAASPCLDSHCATFDTIVDDLHWVIGRLLHTNSQQQSTQSQPKAAPSSHFPGHGERDPGKRRIKPSSKACSRD